MSSSSSTPHPLARQKAVADALAGVVGSLVSLWITYPVDCYKTNLQAGKGFTGQEDLVRLFAGWKTKTLHTTTSSFMYFYLYSWIMSKWTERHHSRKPSPPTLLLLSAAAAMLNTCVTLPLDVLSARHQTDTASEDHSEKRIRKYPSEDCCESLMVDESQRDDDDDDDDDEEKKDDVQAQAPLPVQQAAAAPHTPREAILSWIKDASHLWKGLTPSLLLCSNPAIHYTVFDLCKTRLLNRHSNSGQQSNNNLTMAQAFVLGLCAKFVATIATYPLIRTKVLLMVSERNDVLHCLKQEYRQHGVAGLYKGCNWQLVHSLLKSALLMMIRERISRTTNRMLLSESTVSVQRR